MLHDTKGVFTLQHMLHDTKCVFTLQHMLHDTEGVFTLQHMLHDTKGVFTLQHMLHDTKGVFTLQHMLHDTKGVFTWQHMLHDTHVSCNMFCHVKPTFSPLQARHGLLRNSFGFMQVKCCNSYICSCRWQSRQHSQPINWRGIIWQWFLNSFQWKK